MQESNGSALNPKEGRLSTSAGQLPLFLAHESNPAWDIYIGTQFFIWALTDALVTCPVCDALFNAT